MKLYFGILLILCASSSLAAQDTDYILTADRVFDGSEMHSEWSVVIKSNRIVDVGNVLDLKNQYEALSFEAEK